MGRVPGSVAAVLLLLSAAASVDIDTSDVGYREARVPVSDSIPPDESIIDNIKLAVGKSNLGLTSPTRPADVSNRKATHLADPSSGSGSFFTTALLAATTAMETSIEPEAEYSIDDFIMVNSSTESGNSTSGAVDTVHSFQRVASGGSFQVTGEIMEEQVPPGNIQDLAVTDVRPGGNNTLLVQLTWTWPGAHLTSGNASSVDIRTGKNYAGLDIDFEIQTKITVVDVAVGNLDPLPPGSRHVVTLSLPRTLASLRQDGALNWNAYLAARVLNKYGLKSEKSNVVHVSYVPPPVTRTADTTAETTATDATANKAPTTEATNTEATATTDTTDAEKECSKKSRFVTSPWFWIGLACIAGGIFIFIVVAVLVFLRRKKSMDFQ